MVEPSTKQGYADQSRLIIVCVQKIYLKCSIYIDKRQDHRIWFHIYLTYLSVFHCCIDIGVFINEEHWEVI